MPGNMRGFSGGRAECIEAVMARDEYNPPPRRLSVGINPRYRSYYSCPPVC